MGQRDDPTGDRFFALHTFRRDGTAVRTPIWLAGNGNRWYAYTPGRSWKVRRLRRDGRVEVARSDYHGEPRGAWHAGTARVVAGGDLRVIRRELTAKYGNRFRLFRLVTRIASPRNGSPVGLVIDLDTPVEEAE
jgi:uncharacterized protein